MLGRLGKDVEEYRSAKDASTRQALILLWLVTAVIVLLMIDFLWGLLRNVGLL